MPAAARSPSIETDGARYVRIPIRTRVVVPEDDIVAVAREYAGTLVRPDDILFVSEKVVAITQGRAVPTSRIRPGLLARLLWRHVRQVPYGIGLRNPYSMQCAIEECGGARILLAAAVSACGKLLGRRGDFYRIAGVQAAAIDAPGTAGIEQFRDCVIKGPAEPDRVAEALAAALGCRAAVVDVNDLGAAVLGYSTGVDAALVCRALRDNPLGQGAEQTPLGILRRE
jgi:hypothetical protein